MKILIVDYQEVFFTSLWPKFEALYPSEVKAKFNVERGGVQFEAQRYWIRVDDPLATECLLRDIGRVVEQD